ncbi:MAG: S26 family signal peptidase, partial [Bacteroidia bacterium]
IDGKLQEQPKKAQHFYYVKTAGALFGTEIKLKNGRTSLSNLQLLDKYDIYATEVELAAYSKDTMVYKLNMTKEVSEEISKLEGVVSVTRKNDRANEREITIFPHNPAYAWNNDNFGPLIIPKAGLTINIDTHNVCLYEKVMSTYDDGIHHITKSGGQVLYDGNPITSYKFKQDYYFMMGDNRHNSADSRSWGLVPFDHVVGSPFFIWLSIKYEENNPVSGESFVKSFFKDSKSGKYRWNRFLCYVDDGELHSIKIPFIATILAIWGLSKWNRKRKENAVKKDSKQ